MDSEEQPSLFDLLPAAAAASHPTGTRRPGSSLRILPLDRLRPHPIHPRRTVDREGLTRLATTVAREGIVEPLVVWPAPSGDFFIVRGVRRWEAARLAGMTQAPVIVVKPESALHLRLLLDLHREALCAVDEAEALAAAADANAGTDGELAVRLGIHQSRISRARQIAGLDPETKALSRERGISAAVLSELAGEALSDADRARLLTLPPEHLTREKVRAAVAEARSNRVPRPKLSWPPRRLAHSYVQRALRVLVEDPSFVEEDLLAMTLRAFLELTNSGDPS